MAAVPRGVEQGSTGARNVGILICVSETRLALRRKFAAAPIPAGNELYERQPNAPDPQNDRVVYEMIDFSHIEEG